MGRQNTSSAGMAIGAIIAKATGADIYDDIPQKARDNVVHARCQPSWRSTAQTHSSVGPAWHSLARGPWCGRPRHSRCSTERGREESRQRRRPPSATLFRRNLKTKRMPYQPPKVYATIRTFDPPADSWEASAKKCQKALAEMTQAYRAPTRTGNVFKYFFWSGWLVAIGCIIAISIMASQRPDPVQTPAVPKNAPGTM